MTTLTSPVTGYYDNLVALVDVVEDHARDLDIAQSDVTVWGIHLATNTRADALTLADRLGLTHETDPVSEQWVGTYQGRTVRVSDWSGTTSQRDRLTAATTPTSRVGMWADHVSGSLDPRRVVRDTDYLVWLEGPAGREIGPLPAENYTYLRSAR